MEETEQARKTRSSDQVALFFAIAYTTVLTIFGDECQKRLWLTLAMYLLRRILTETYRGKDGCERELYQIALIVLEPLIRILGKGLW